MSRYLLYLALHVYDLEEEERKHIAKRTSQRIPISTRLGMSLRCLLPIGISFLLYYYLFLPMVSSAGPVAVHVAAFVLSLLYAIWLVVVGRRWLRRWLPYVWLEMRRIGIDVCSNCGHDLRGISQTLLGDCPRCKTDRRSMTALWNH